MLALGEDGEGRQPVAPQHGAGQVSDEGDALLAVGADLYLAPRHITLDREFLGVVVAGVPVAGLCLRRRRPGDARAQRGGDRRHRPIRPLASAGHVMHFQHTPSWRRAAAASPPRVYSADDPR